MRDQWYGDNRDLVKWGVLVHLAREYEVKRIIHVAYFRPTTWPSLHIDGKEYPIPESVIEHFRKIGNITSLKARPHIQVIGSQVSERARYTEEVLEAIAAYGSERCMVFLDPDTGLAPRKAGLEHVLGSELAGIWQKMHQGDVLVFYQHQTNRRGEAWVESKREQFKNAIGLDRGAAKLALAPGIARDVVFFYCQKGPESRARAAYPADVADERRVGPAARAARD